MRTSLKTRDWKFIRINLPSRKSALESDISGGVMTIGIRIALLCSAATACLLTSIIRADSPRFEVPAGSHPHDVAPTPAGGPVYFTAQRSGNLGILDPATGHVDLVALGPGSAPHGVIVGPDGAAWVTDGGRDAVVRVDAKSEAVKAFPLPKDHANTNLNTATLDRDGVLWFTGQN